ncbi:hypothetical protein AVEN_100666-1 [Araneus ventricosus]|uniref:Uncharacterized protein n=1 Tax=Araneus ventricosus TaxID=182803 RepID=A0A4Y2S3Q4_ARAVE|nr:hypothetical protein AVEN_100666-1 [Araneus ventricosus]
MKYLAVFLLVGLAFASAYASDFDGAFSADRFENVDPPLQVGGWITDRMRDSLQVMIDGFEKRMKEGKSISYRVFKKVREVLKHLS